MAKLQETPKALAALVRGVSDDVLRRKPVPAKWSMLEIACHLRDVEEFFVERYGKLANHFAWSVEHQVEHDANHLGQIRALRDRFGGSQ